MTQRLALLLILSTLTAMITTPAWAADRRTRKEVERRVEAAKPGTDWETRRIEDIDINCDGNVDFGIIGTRNGVIHVGVVLGPINRTTGAFVIDLPTGASGEVVCDDDPALMVQSSDYNPAELLGGQIPEGFQQSETCKELAVGLACWKFHIYWNHTASRLGVWK